MDQPNFLEVFTQALKPVLSVEETFNENLKLANPETEVTVENIDAIYEISIGRGAIFDIFLNVRKKILASLRKGMIQSKWYTVFNDGEDFV